MSKTVRQVQFLPSQPKALRVAAYARVSSGKDAMLNSLSAQVSYFNDYIQNQPGWIYCGVYTDAAKTGTSENREGFQQLLEACRARKIDQVITKSISRFARNTVTLLSMVRELSALGVDVFFQRENIHSMSGDGEVMLSILASFAQEESRSASENQLWRVKKNFEEGKPWNCTMLGYRNDNGQLQVVPEEAEIVRTIYQMYLAGSGTLAIAKHLNERGFVGRRGRLWHEHTVSRVLTNYCYTGNLLLQKTYSENHITKKRHPNIGQYPMYHAEGAHEPIIDLETFEAVQAEMKVRAEKWVRCTEYVRYPFSSFIECSNCGSKYRRRYNNGKHYWSCATSLKRGTKYCRTSMIPEATLYQITEDLLGSVEQLRIQVEKILAQGKEITFCFKDGRRVTKAWEYRSRRESWTPEMREAARQNRLRREKDNGNKNSHGNSCND